MVRHCNAGNFLIRSKDFGITYGPASARMTLMWQSCGIFSRISSETVGQSSATIKLKRLWQFPDRNKRSYACQPPFAARSGIILGLLKSFIRGVILKIKLLAVEFLGSSRGHFFVSSGLFPEQLLEVGSSVAGVRCRPQLVDSLRLALESKTLFEIDDDWNFLSLPTR